jgi:hypothetical protein
MVALLKKAVSDQRLTKQKRFQPSALFLFTRDAPVWLKADG